MKNSLQGLRESVICFVSRFHGIGGNGETKGVLQRKRWKRRPQKYAAFVSIVQAVAWVWYVEPVKRAKIWNKEEFSLQPVAGGRLPSVARSRHSIFANYTNRKHAIRRTRTLAVEGNHIAALAPRPLQESSYRPLSQPALFSFVSRFLTMTWKRETTSSLSFYSTDFTPAADRPAPGRGHSPGEAIAQRKAPPHNRTPLGTK